MAWPVDAPLTSFISNVTTITASFMNAIQAPIYGLVGGSKSIKKAAIDGVGDNDSSAIPAGQFYIDGKAAEATASVKMSDIVTAYNVRVEGSGASAKVRLVQTTTGWERWTNCYYVAGGGNNWARDTAGTTATREVLLSGVLSIYYYTAPPATWPTSDWTARQSLGTTTSGDVTAARNVEALAGNVIATGDPASDQARVKGKQFVSTASLATAGAGLVVAGVGQAAAPANANVVLAGTDLGGTITVTTGAGVIAGIVATITYTKAFPNGSVVTLTPRDAATAALALPAFTTAGATIWTLNTTGAGALANPGVYVWNYSVSGY